MGAVAGAEEVIAEPIMFARVWSMPNKNTFDIPQIRSLVRKYCNGAEVILNPFCGYTSIGTHTNDLNPEIFADEHLDAIVYLKKQPSLFSDVVLFDPPFSQEQAKRAYAKVGMENFAKNSAWFSELKIEIMRISKQGGVVISCGWNSGGMGINRGFRIVDGLLICHGAAHNDTIVTVEKKI